MSYWKIVIVGAIFTALILVGVAFITKKFSYTYTPSSEKKENFKIKTKIIKLFDNMEIRPGEKKCTETLNIEGYNKMMLFLKGPSKEDFPFCSHQAEACCHFPIQVDGYFVLEGTAFDYSLPVLPSFGDVSCNEKSVQKAVDIAFPEIQYCLSYRIPDEPGDQPTVKIQSLNLFLTQ